MTTRDPAKVDVVSYRYAYPGYPTGEGVQHASETGPLLAAILARPSHLPRSQTLRQPSVATSITGHRPHTPAKHSE